MTDRILKWKNLTEEITSGWIEYYFQLSEEDIKYGIDYDWVAGDVGGVFEFTDYWFSFSNVLDCYKYKISREQLFSWYDWCLENQSVNISLVRYILSPQEKKEQEEKHLAELKERVESAKKEFETALENYGK